MSKYIVFRYDSLQLIARMNKTRREKKPNTVSRNYVINTYTCLITDGVIKDSLRSRHCLYIHVVLQFLPKQFVIIDDGSPLKPWGPLTYGVLYTCLSSLFDNLQGWFWQSASVRASLTGM